MSEWMWVLVVIAGVIALFILLNIINILQAGSKKPHGKSMAQILGKNPEDATYDDVERLSRKGKMQLFIAAETPEFSELSGEYEARLLSGGVLGKSTELFTHHVFPTGGITLRTRWVGKAFKPESNTAGTGYNIFKEKKGSQEAILRIRKIRTYLGPSTIAKDGKNSFHIDYRPYNGGIVRSMHDELRKINVRLYIGMGYMGLGGGSANPGPFVLVGTPAPWIGWD